MPMDGKTIFQQLMACAERHPLPVATESVADLELKCGLLESFEILFVLPDMLHELFPTISTVHFDEHESSPEDFYPDLFDHYCGLTSGAFAPLDASFVQVEGAGDGDVRNGALELSFTWQDQAQTLRLPGTERGFYSMSLADQLNAFAEAHLAGRWLVVEGEDSRCTVLYLPVAAYEELDKMVKDWMESLGEE